MTGPEDVLEAIRRRWATTALPTLVPGGLHHGQAPQTVEGELAPFPYAVVMITDGEVQFSSASVDTAGGHVILLFDVEIKVYVNSLEPNVDTRKIRTEIDKHFNRDKATDMFITPGRCLDWRAIGGGGLMLDPDRNEARDVAICARRWEVTVQGVV